VTLLQLLHDFWASINHLSHWHDFCLVAEIDSLVQLAIKIGDPLAALWPKSPGLLTESHSFMAAWQKLSKIVALAPTLASASYCGTTVLILSSKRTMQQVIQFVCLPVVQLRQQRHCLALMTPGFRF
jgi:hypothetical protein